MTLDDEILDLATNKKTVRFSTNIEQPLQTQINVAKNIPIKATIQDAENTIPIYDSWHLATPDLSRLANKYQGNKETASFYETLQGQLQNTQEINSVLSKLRVSLNAHVNGDLNISTHAKKVQVATIGTLSYLSAVTSTQLLQQRYKENTFEKAELAFNAAKLHQDVHQELYEMHQGAVNTLTKGKEWEEERCLTETQQNLVLTQQGLASFYPQVVQRSTNYVTTNLN